MKKNRPLLWLIPLIVLLLLVPFIVPSALPYAGAESDSLPVYTPVELENPNPEPLLPLPSPKEAFPTPYDAKAENFVTDEATGAPIEYRDSTLYVKIESRTVNNTKVYFTWIQIADPSQLRTQITRETSPVKLAQRLRAMTDTSSTVSLRGFFPSNRMERLCRAREVIPTTLFISVTAQAQLAKAKAAREEQVPGRLSLFHPFNSSA